MYLNWTSCVIQGGKSKLKGSSIMFTMTILSLDHLSGENMMGRGDHQYSLLKIISIGEVVTTN